MLGLFMKKEKPLEKIKTRLLKRLRNTSNQELMRWSDNILNGLGKDFREITRALSHGTTEEALVYLQDARTGAVSLLASIQVIEERINSNR